MSARHGGSLRRNTRDYLEWSPEAHPAIRDIVNDLLNPDPSLRPPYHTVRENLEGMVHAWAPYCDVNGFPKDKLVRHFKEANANGSRSITVEP